MLGGYPPLLPTGNRPLNSLMAGEMSPQVPGMMPPIVQGEVMPEGFGGGRGSSRLYDANGSEIAQIQSWTRADMDRWDLRNTRFQEDQEMYTLAPPPNVPRNRLNLVTLNDPQTLVDKVTRIVARHPNVIDISPAPGVDPSIAQKMENYLYEVDRAINQRWIGALNNPYRYDQAFSAVLRGWICERTMLNLEGLAELPGDPSALWDHQIVEPACVYPYKAGGKIRRVTHAYATSVGEIVRDPLLRPFLDPDWYEQDERSLCHVTAVYWESLDGGWYHAVIGGVGPGSGLAGNAGLWIKPPVELGYNPWTIVLCGGAGFRETPWDDQEYVEHVGTGILSGMRDNQKQMNRIVTRLNELLAQEANPAITVFTNTGMIKRVDLTAGGRNLLGAQDKIEVHRVGQEPRDFTLLWEILKERAARSGLPDSYFGNFPSENAFAASVMMSAGRDVLFPIAEGVNAADALKFRKMLELYRDFGPGIPLPTKMPQGNGMAQGLEQFSSQIAGQMVPSLGMGGQQPGQQGQQFSPLGQVMAATLDVWEVHQQGVYVEISREDMTPQEIAQRINLALAMVEKQIISRETARKEYVKVRNPGAENVKILAETVYQSPDIVKLLIPLTLSDTGQHFLRQLWDVTQNMVPAQGAPNGAPQPTGQPGSSGGASGRNGSLPTNVAPAAAMGNQLANTRVGQADPQAAMMNELLSLVNGGAQGGAGGGGMPPPGGQGSPVPLTPPPGQW